MTQVAFAHDALLPRPPGGNGPGAAMALVVHAGLAVALTLSVDWRSKPVDLVSAELWASVPQAAAPAAEAPALPAPEPAPTPAPAPGPAPPPVAAKPPEPDIALERAERRKAEAVRQQAEAAEAEAKKKQKREQAEREAKAGAQAAAQAAEQARVAQQREANLKRIMGQAGEAGGRAGTATQDAAPSAAYIGRIAKLIRDQSVFTGVVQGNPAAEVEVRTGAGGTILSKRVVKSSGSAEWDEAVKRAIDKVGRLPPDSDGRVPTALTIAFKPYE